MLFGIIFLLVAPPLKHQAAATGAATGDAALLNPGYVATGLNEPARFRPFAKKAA